LSEIKQDCSIAFRSNNLAFSWPISVARGGAHVDIVAVVLLSL
jgi:hypothetical protein